MKKIIYIVWLCSLGYGCSFFEDEAPLQESTLAFPFMPKAGKTEMIDDFRITHMHTIYPGLEITFEPKSIDQFDFLQLDIIIKNTSKGRVVLRSGTAKIEYWIISPHYANEMIPSHFANDLIKPDEKIVIIQPGKSYVFSISEPIFREKQGIYLSIPPFIDHLNGILIEKVEP